MCINSNQKYYELIVDITDEHNITYRIERVYNIILISIRSLLVKGIINSGFYCLKYKLDPKYYPRESFNVTTTTNFGQKLNLGVVITPSSPGYPIEGWIYERIEESKTNTPTQILMMFSYPIIIR